MARLMLEPYNLLVLDEPTNHMDMRSKDILKRALQKYDGTVVVVSHDREFLDGIVDKVYEFRDGGVKEYLGGIYYSSKSAKLDSLRDVRAQGAAPAAAPKTEAPKLTYEQKKSRRSCCANCAVPSKSIETELAETERRIADYDARFAAATAYDEADYKAYDDLKAHYDHLMHEWEKASLRTRNHRKRLTSPMNVLLLNASPRPRGSSRRRSTQRPRQPGSPERKRSRPSSTVRRSPPARDVCAAARPASVRCRTMRRTSWAKRSAAPTCSSSELRPTGAGWPRG